MSNALDEITRWASQFRQGDFSARLELNDPQHALVLDNINRLAEWLESLAQQRSNELKQRTAQIKKQSRSLRLVYDITAGLNETHDVEGFISRYLPALRSASQALLAEAYLYDEDGNETLLCALEAEPLIDNRIEIVRSESHCMVIPLSFKDRIYGLYRLYMNTPISQIDPATRELLENLGLNLGMALEKTQQEQDSILLGRMAERTAFAHELHDSMAQTLASLRFQVHILDDTLRAGDPLNTRKQMQKVDKLVQSAHQELRSLIGQFRAPIESGSLAAGFKKILARFRTETGILVDYQNDWQSIALSEDVEVNIIRIAQEALKNVQKHSGADAVQVLLSQLENGECQMQIKDNGEGLPPELNQSDESTDYSNHIGLSVMQERAQLIGGSLSIQSSRGEGAQILLSFKPQ